jgi:hypothetical protein
MRHAGRVPDTCNKVVLYDQASQSRQEEFLYKLVIVQNWELQLQAEQNHPSRPSPCPISSTRRGIAQYTGRTKLGALLESALRVLALPQVGQLCSADRY